MPCLRSATVLLDRDLDHIGQAASLAEGPELPVSPVSGIRGHPPGNHTGVQGAGDHRLGQPWFRDLSISARPERPA
jgi:hypothetical protein